MTSSQNNMACSGFLVIFKGAIIFEYLITILMIYNILRQIHWWQSL